MKKVQGGGRPYSLPAAGSTPFKTIHELVENLPDQLLNAIVRHFAEPASGLGGDVVDVMAEAARWSSGEPRKRSKRGRPPHDASEMGEVCGRSRS